MSLDTLRTVLLLVGTLTMGLVAGAFALYAHTVMPGLRTTDDRTFVAAFQALDRAIINPWFMAGGFVGALVLTLAGGVATLGEPSFPWVVASLVLYLFSFVATIAVNVPLNDALKAAGDPATIADLGAVRERFDEARWTAWNLGRTLTTLGAFGCLAWALVLHGRATG